MRIGPRQFYRAGNSIGCIVGTIAPFGGLFLLGRSRTGTGLAAIGEAVEKELGERRGRPGEQNKGAHGPPYKGKKNEQIAAEKAEYKEQARKLCRLGATDVQLADFFGVTEKTLNNWKNKYPGFLQSLKEGKEIADASAMPTAGMRPVQMVNLERRSQCSGHRHLYPPHTRQIVSRQNYSGDPNSGEHPE